LLLAAFRLALIHGAAPLVSLQRSRVIPKDYQIVQVVMALRQPRVRMLIADDVGLGKTIEAGLIVTELLARGLANRLLVICPANLREQWQEALDYFFHLDARIISSRHIREMERELPAGANPWAHCRALITSVDFAKQPALKGQILEQRWDIVIVDEAHAAAKPHLSHPLVRRLIEQVKAGFFAGSAGSGRVAYVVTPDVAEVTALAQVIARYAYTLGGETTNVELLNPIAATLDGTTVRWGREARPLLAPALRLTSEQVPLADVRDDVAEFLGSPRLDTLVADVIERQRQELEAEYQQFAGHYIGEGGATPTIRLEARSSDLLTVTILYPKV
jgi:hypothetical protein